VKRQAVLVTRAGFKREFLLEYAYRDFRRAEPEMRHRVLVPYHKRFYDNERADQRSLDPLPRVRPRAFLHHARAAAERLAPEVVFELPHRLVGEALCATLVVDEGTQFRDCGPDFFKAQGSMFEAAWPEAVERLRTVAPSFTVMAPGVYGASSRDGHAGALFLLPERIDALGLKGRAIAMAPTTTLFLVTSADDSAALAALVQLAEASLETSRPLSTMPLERVGSGWAPFSSSFGSPLHSLTQRAWLEAYAQQKSLMEAEEGNALTHFWSTLEGALHASGEIRTRATLATHVPSLMPRCDVAAVLRENPVTEEVELIEVSFATLTECLGEALELRTDLWPPRWQFDDEPGLGPSTLEALRARAIKHVVTPRSALAK
jgi:hypothetical protein